MIAEEEDKTPGSAAAAAAGGGEGESQDFAATIAKDFSELIGLCRSWEKDARLASLALEGALSCLRSLKGRRRSLAEVDGGGNKNAIAGHESKAVLEEAFEALASAVRHFFAKRRGGGFTPLQVSRLLNKYEVF